MLAPVASIHALNGTLDPWRRGWSGQARPWRVYCLHPRRCDSIRERPAL